MNPFSLNVMLALIWAALVGTFTLSSLVIGFVLGYFALLLVRSQFSNTNYFERVIGVFRLIFRFIYELIVSGCRVVWAIVTPSNLSRPGIIAMPLTVRGEMGVLVTTNLISLTPGSLVLDVSEDGRTLFVHAMFVEDPDQLRRDIHDGIERYVKEAME